LIKDADPHPDPESMKSCPGCNFLVDDDADDCRYCGTSTEGVAAGSVAAPESKQVVGAHRESVSTRLTAGVIVVASLSVVGVGAWAFHHSPPPAASPRTPAATAPAGSVRFRKVTTVSDGVSYSVDAAVGTTDPDLSHGIVSKYATAREFDVVHIPGGSGTDLTSMLGTFAAGWPTTDTQTSTKPAGPALSFTLTSDTQLTQGVLIDAGANGVFLVAVKAPLGSTISPLDSSVLARAAASLAVGA
jgi:hypothetical protein